MNKRLLFAGIAIAVAVFAVGAVGCKSSKKSTKATPTVAARATQGATPKATQSLTPSTTTTGASTTPSGATVNVTQNATLGKILTDASGKTLYKYASDQPGVSACTATCAQAWPPLTIASGAPIAGTGVAGALATIQRSDGTTQVTLDGSPLYYFANDTAAGDATGDGVGGFSVIKLGG